MKHNCKDQSLLKVANHLNFRSISEIKGLPWVYKDFHATLSNYIEGVLTTGKHDFSARHVYFSNKKDNGIRMHTNASLIDRLIIQELLIKTGCQIQDEIESNCNDELMPIPPSTRFLRPEKNSIYSKWEVDFNLWQKTTYLFASRGYSHFLQTDINNFFSSVDRNTLMEMLSQYFPEKTDKQLINDYLNSPLFLESQQMDPVDGLPIGEPVSHLFANLYLSAFDRWVTDQKVPYIRYVDDMRFFAHSAKECDEILHKVSRYLLAHFNLNINYSKVRIVELPKIEYLNYECSLLEEIKKLLSDPLSEYRFFVPCNISEMQTVIDNIKFLITAQQNGSLQISFDSIFQLDHNLDRLAGFKEGEDVQGYLERLNELFQWALTKTESPHILRLQRLCAGKLAYHNNSDTLEIAKGILDNNITVSRMIAFKILSRVRTMDSRLKLEQFLLKHNDTIDDDQLVKMLEIFRKSYRPSNELESEFINHNNPRVRALVLSTATSGERLIEILKGESDHFVNLNAAIRIYYAKCCSEAIYELWKEILLSPLMHADLRAVLIMWSVFLKDKFDVQSFFIRNHVLFTPFEKALFSDTLTSDLDWKDPDSRGLNNISEEIHMTSEEHDTLQDGVYAF